MATDSFTHHGVLAHEHNGSSTETHTDLLHLLRADIVCADHKTFGVIIQELLEKSIANITSLNSKQRNKFLHKAL
jgi:hypothetical protein